MDRTLISRIAHTDHPIAAPVSTGRMRSLTRALGRGQVGEVVDLGCGSGEWLLEILTASESLAGTGVDLHLHPDLDAKARARGVGDRVRWVEADAASWYEGPADLVACIGASHAFGGLDGTLGAVVERLRPGGRALLGDAIWECPPSPVAQSELEAGPEDLPDLAGFVERVESRGFEVGDAHVSTLAEWDDYEWSWTGALTRWALARPSGSAERAEALDVARTHRHGWLAGYRGQLGFVTAVLHDTRSA